MELQFDFRKTGESLIDFRIRTKGQGEGMKPIREYLAVFKGMSHNDSFAVFDIENRQRSVIVTFFNYYKSRIGKTKFKLKSRRFESGYIFTLINLTKP